MKKLKKSRFFSLGRKWVFTLALFLLVFSVASILKVKAGTGQNFRGWLWGGSENPSIGGSLGTWPPDGNETGLGWISVNSLNCDANNDGKSDGATGCPSSGTAFPNYGVNIPEGDGDVSGYAWSENVGWVSFNRSDLGTCPSGDCGAKRVGNTLTGWARIMAIPQAGMNAGGWGGWIRLAGANYRVKINADSTFAKCSATGDGCAWNGEETIAGVPQGFGWIDFGSSKIKMCQPLVCATKTICQGQTFPSCDASFCGGLAGQTCTPSGTTWTCSDDCGKTLPCTTSTTVVAKVDGQCGTASGTTICDGHALTAGELCTAGTLPDPAPVMTGYDASWVCKGACLGSDSSTCTAKGMKSCGWMETN